MDLSQERLASRSVEVVQEIGQQHEVVTLPNSTSSTAFDGCKVTIGDSRFLRVLLLLLRGRLSSRAPISAWIVLCERDAEETMPGGDVENQFAIRVRIDEFGHQLRRQIHQCSHRARKCYPNWIIRTDGAVVRHRRAAFAHRFAMYFTPSISFGSLKLDRAAEIRGRAFVEKHRRVERQAVAIASCLVSISMIVR